MYGSRPQSAPMGRGPMPAAASSVTTQQQQNATTSASNTLSKVNSASALPIGRPSSAIAHLRLATALQQQNQNQQQHGGSINSITTANVAPSKLLRPQSAAVAGRYLPQQHVQQLIDSGSATDNINNHITAAAGGGNENNNRTSSAVGFFLADSASASDNNNNGAGVNLLTRFGGGGGGNAAPNTNGKQRPITNEDAAVVASLKGEIMLLQRVLETVDDFDLLFPPTSASASTPRGGGGGGASGVAAMLDHATGVSSGAAADGENNNNNFSSLQHHHNNNNVPTPSAELQIIEQQLIAIQPSNLSDKSLADAKIALLELLVERIKAVSVAVLRKCDYGAAELRVMPSRTSGFTTVVKYMMEIAERKRAWEHRMRMLQQVNNGEHAIGGNNNTAAFYQGMVPSPPINNSAAVTPTQSSLSKRGGSAVATTRNLSPARLAAIQAQQAAQTAQDLANVVHQSSTSPIKLDPRVMQSVAATHPITLLDLALNEPTVTEIQNLIAEQKQLQASLRRLLQQPMMTTTTMGGGGESPQPGSLQFGPNGVISRVISPQSNPLNVANGGANYNQNVLINAQNASSTSTVNPMSAAAGGKAGGGVSQPSAAALMMASRGVGGASTTTNMMMSNTIAGGGIGHHSTTIPDLAIHEQMPPHMMSMMLMGGSVAGGGPADASMSVATAGGVGGISTGGLNTNPPTPRRAAGGASSSASNGKRPAGGKGGRTPGEGGLMGASNSRNANLQMASFAENQLKTRTAELHALSEKFEELKREMSAVRKSKDEVEKELAGVRARDMAQKMEFECEWDIRNKVSGIAFGNEMSRLLKYGVDADMLANPTVGEAESAVLASKLHQFIAESTQFVAENNNNPKGKKLVKASQDELAALQAKQLQLIGNAPNDRQQVLSSITPANSTLLLNGSSASSSPQQYSTSLSPTTQSVTATRTRSGTLSGGGGRNNSTSNAAGNNSLFQTTAEWGFAGLNNLSQLVALLPRSEAIDGSVWAAISRQNAIISKLLDQLDRGEQDKLAANEAAAEEKSRLTRIIKTLEERIDGFKLSNMQLKQSAEQLKSEFNDRISGVTGGGGGGLGQQQQQHPNGDASGLNADGSSYGSLKRSSSGGGPNNASAKNFTTPADRVRIVQTKNQPMTAAEREKDLHKTINAKDKKIEHIADQLRAAKHEIDDKCSEIATMSRERLSLLSKCSEESLKVQALQKQLDEAFAVRDQSQDTALTIKRELREKTVLEADNAQKLWKSQVELHIAHNVIAELRKREQQLLDDLEDHVEQRRILRDRFEMKSTEAKKMQTAFELQLEEARAAVDAAKYSLYQERQQMLANEKEMERLRVVDVQLETMEQNFNNYAVSMIVKREAGEEEERILGECLGQIQSDVFALPEESNMGEEQLTLLLAKLMHKKEMLENEARLQKQAEMALTERKRHLMAQTSSSNNKTDNKNAPPNMREGPSEADVERASIATAEEKLSNKKRLGLLLQRRYNDIQIFAAERRLTEVRRARELRETVTELNSVQQVHETMLKELSQTRSQLDAMAQRNTELEVERKQLMRDREREELSNRRLQAQVQRLNVTTETQENMLVDLGTRLQNEKIAATSPTRRGTSPTSHGGGGGGGLRTLSQSQTSQGTLGTTFLNDGGGSGTFKSGSQAFLGGTTTSSNQQQHNQQQGGKKQYDIAPLGPVL